MADRKRAGAVLLCVGLLLFALAWKISDGRTVTPVLPPPVPFVTSTLPVAPVPTSTRPSPAPTRPPPEAVLHGSPSTTTLQIPNELRLDVPFLSQAPKKDWSMPYQEACEEASVLMVQVYFANRRTNFSPEEGDAALLSLIRQQAEARGPDHIDSAVEEIAEDVERFMPELDAHVIRAESIDQIKSILAQGFPIVLPADGKVLKNPHFRNGGPRYHMLVLKGYLADGRWITNDPGTQFGEHLLYPQQHLFEVIHDWNGGDVPNGEPLMLVLLPKNTPLRIP